MKESLEHHHRYCSRCMRALKVCLCEHITPIMAQTSVTILQHPNEVGHPKGTAALLAASLPHTAIYVGEDFSHHTPLISLLRDPQRRIYLLWPDEQAILLQTLRQQVIEQALDPNMYGFILLDGTWRKAYRMLQSNPLLACLPRISLGAVSGQFAIRKKPFADALSTIEAGYHLVSQWEGEAERFSPLLTLFNQLNRQWLTFSERHSLPENKESSI